MRPFSTLLPFETALDIVSAAVRPIEATERLSLDAAGGRVLAEDIVAAIDVPPFDRAAMDGYAVVADNTDGATDGSPIALRLAHRLHAGDTPQSGVRPGECVEIATGAPLPPGADAVVMVEQTANHGDEIRIFRAVRPGQNVGRAGSDIGCGRPVVRAGRELTPARLGALAAAGVSSVVVFGRPTVAIVATGNELTPAGQPLQPGHIFESNSVTLAGVVRAHGGVAKPLGIAGDSVDELAATFANARQHDIVIFTGGSSVGERDLVVDAIAGQASVRFHGIAVRPGKPTLFAVAGSTPVFGMPGNPTSCLSNAYLFVVPLLRATARLTPWRPERVTLPLAREINSPADRHQFYTVRIGGDAIEPAFKTSSDTTSMADADGYIEIPAGQGKLAAGTLVTVTKF